MIALRLRSLRSLPVLLVALPGLLQAQGTTRTLSKPEAEFAEPFSLVAAVRELRDGRVLVSDTRDKVVQLVDLKAGKALKVGREGSGPGEYGLPMQLLGVPGDSSIIFDPLNSRYLTILPNGKPGSTFRLEDGAPPPKVVAGDGPAAGRNLSSIRAPRSADAQGRLYFEGSPISFGPNGPVASDSAPVLRYDRKTWRYDTLTFVQLPKNSAEVKTSGSGGERNVQVRVGGGGPFPARDAWTVLPNGSVMVVRVKDYHVDIISPSKQIARGPAVPFTPIRVGEAEKQEYRDSQKSPSGVGITRSVENGKVTTGSAPIAPAEEPKEWPAVKPPLTPNGVLATPTGEIWVSRSRSAKDEIPRYDVFSAAGKLIGSVVLPKKTRVIGFGSGGAIYTIRTDADDLQYLQRFRG